jgi:hypothetical protein
MRNVAQPMNIEETENTKIRVWSSVICGGQSGAGAGFSEYFGFPCQSSFQQLLHNHPHLLSGAGTISQKWPQYKGLSPTPLAIKNYYYYYLLC